MDLQIIEMLDATPDIILRNGGTDEQGLLTRVRYNRLVDTFLGITAYHVQGHIRTYVRNVGQIEIDDLYLGVDKYGRQYTVPVGAKGKHEPMGVVQAICLNAYGRATYPDLTLRSIAIKAWTDGTIFFMEFNNATDSEAIPVLDYRRYRLVREEDTTADISDVTGHTNG